MEVANRSNEDFLRPPVHRMNHNLESVIYSVKGVLTRQVTACKGWLTRQVAINLHITHRWVSRVNE